MILPSFAPSPTILADSLWQELIDGLSPRSLEVIDGPWERQRRANQTPPAGNWQTWLIMAGRGFGKTRTGAEFIRDRVMAGTMKRVALVGPTAADVRDVMIRGESGLLACCRRYGFTPHYEPSKRLVTFPNGAIATAYSADEPDRLNGPQHDGAWSDELGVWRYGADAWDMLQFGLRLGDDPQQVVTTTPKPVSMVRTLVKQAKEPNSDVVMTGGSTNENASNLAKSFLQKIGTRYANTRLGRQEIEGELLEDVEGALWNLAQIDDTRLDKVPDGVDLSIVVVGIDPAATSGESSAETGIIVVARGSDGHGYVLADYSLRGTPNEWGGAAVQAYDDFDADHVTPETNNGGEMVTNTLQTIRPSLPIRPVHASRGKATRAEPISALYEQGRMHHVGTFPALEDQMCLAGETLVLTEWGWKRIDRIDAGEMVWTRVGLRRVIWSGMTQRRTYVCKVITTDGRTLIATIGHPVYTLDKGFIPVSELTSGDILECVRWDGERLASTGQRDDSENTVHRWSGAGVFGAWIRRVITGTLGVNCSTMPFGRQRTGRSLRALKSTIVTKILAPMTLPTSNRLPALSTTSGTLAASRSGRTNSTAQNLATVGIASNQPNMFASTADRYSTAHARERAGAPERAAVTIAAIENVSEQIPVYNLTVDDQPEFYANGVLVHNCNWVPGMKSPDRMDALVWGVTDVMLGDEPADLAPVSGETLAALNEWFDS